MNPTAEPIRCHYPPWLPAALAAHLQRRERPEYLGGVSAAESMVLRKKKKILPSLWAERHRIVTMSILSGPWRNYVMPFLAGIMDAAAFSSVQTVIICKSPQSGVSEAAHNFIGYTVDRDPGPVLYVYPDIETAKENSQDRIRPMLESSTRLCTYLTGREDDISINRIKLKHLPIYLAWARSASRLGNKPIKHVIFDETDKYPETAGKTETDPISLGEKRTTTYKRKRKIWKISTPTVETAPIWQAFTVEAQARFDYAVSCPYCAAEQVMKFAQIKFPADERDPEVIEQKSMATYQCEHCAEHLSDDDRNRAVRAGRWLERDKHMELFDYLEKFRPVKIGFHLPAWLSFFVSLSEVAAAFLKAGKNKTKLKDYKNNYEAVPWLIYTQRSEEEDILNLCDDRRRGQFPAGNVVAGLTAAVDTQQDGFWYEIRAWGRGPEEESWKIRGGFVLTFSALEEVLWKNEYYDSDGRRAIVHMTVMDAMGGTRRQTAGVGTRTSEVYEFCRKHKGKILPFKGEQRMAQPYAYSKIDTYPGTNKAIPGGLQLLRANVTYYKNKLANKLTIAPADPGAWHYHSEISADWARQMTSEYLDDNGLWQCPDSRANHVWDVSVYGLVAADVIGIKYWSVPAADPAGEMQNGKTGRSVRNAGADI